MIPLSTYSKPYLAKPPGESSTISIESLNTLVQDMEAEYAGLFSANSHPETQMTSSTEQLAKSSQDQDKSDGNIVPKFYGYGADSGTTAEISRIRYA